MFLGLVPALWFQVFLNGIRLGTYGKMESLGVTRNADGGVSVHRTVAVSAIGGCLGSYIGSPFYLVWSFLISENNFKFFKGANLLFFTVQKI